MSTISNITAGTNIETTVELVKEIDRRINVHAERMRELRAERLAQMPRLAVTEREFLIDVEKTIDVSADQQKQSSELRRNRQLSDEDRDQIAAARLDHRKEINTDTCKEEAIEVVRKAYLTGFKLTHRKDGRIGVSIRGQM
jgi:hypothetical protein